MSLNREQIARLLSLPHLIASQKNILILLGIYDGLTMPEICSCLGVDYVRNRKTIQRPMEWLLDKRYIVVTGDLKKPVYRLGMLPVIHPGEDHG